MTWTVHYPDKMFLVLPDGLRHRLCAMKKCSPELQWIARQARRHVHRGQMQRRKLRIRPRRINGRLQPKRRTR